MAYAKWVAKQTRIALCRKFVWMENASVRLDSLERHTDARISTNVLKILVIRRPVAKTHPVHTNVPVPREPFPIITRDVFCPINATRNLIAIAH